MFLPSFLIRSAGVPKDCYCLWKIPQHVCVCFFFSFSLSRFEPLGTRIVDTTANPSTAKGIAEVVRCRLNHHHNRHMVWRFGMVYGRKSVCPVRMVFPAQWFSLHLVSFIFSSLFVFFFCATLTLGSGEVAINSVGFADCMLWLFPSARSRAWWLAFIG